MTTTYKDGTWRCGCDSCLGLAPPINSPITKEGEYDIFGPPPGNAFNHAAADEEQSDRWWQEDRDRWRASLPEAEG